jgi:drug/metabolite transporter (DMT)-like permease
MGARSWVALGVVYVVWGSTYLAILYGVRTVPPFLGAALRFLVAGLVMLVAVLAVRGRAALRATRAEVATGALVGVLLLCGGNGLVTIGEQRVPSGLAALLVAAVPLWIVVLRCCLGDRPGPVTLLGTLLGLGGVAMLLLPGGAGRFNPAYALLIVLAALSWASGSLLSVRRPLPRDPLALATVEMLAGGLVLLAGSALRGEWSGFSFGRVSGQSWLALGYLAAAGSLLAFTAYVYLLRAAPVSLVSTYAYINPVIAVLLGVLIAGEQLSALTLAGAAVIVLAVAVVVTDQSRVRRRAVAAARPRLAGAARS